MAQKKESDIIISGSPKCLLEPIAKRLNVNLIATELDIEYKVVIGKIMLNREKARVIIGRGITHIDNFYSDSLSDTSVALLADHAYLVIDKGTKLVPWPNFENDKIRENIKSLIPFETGKYIDDYRKSN